MDDILDMSVGFEPGNFPCCPICDNEMQEWEPTLPIRAHGSIALAHTMCIADRRDELGI